MQEMHRNFFKFFGRDLLFPWSVSLLINIISWAVVYFKIRPDSQTVPLHYNLFYGIDIAGSGYMIYFITATGLAILAVNFLFFRYAKSRDVFAANTAAAVALVAQLFILAAILFLKSIIVI